MKKTLRMLVALVCMLTALCVGFALAETVPAEPTPTASPTPEVTPIPTPAPEDLGGLEFVIEGPDESMPMTIKYSDFKDGKYTLEDLLPGTYTVTEVDPDQLLTGLAYTFDEENSVQSVTIEVRAEETEETEEGNVLRNIYVREAQVTPSPTPTPEVTGTPTPEPTETPTPTPQPEEKISIPVTKVWDDMGNRDGNRPEHVVVYLMADGNRTAQAILSAATGWSYEFTELPRYAGTHEIVYTVAEDPVNQYTASVDGFVITNHYVPATTSATVSKIWEDNGNADGLRPLSIYCTLSNGISVELNEANGWTATVDNLPLIVNGQPAEYTWHEQEVIGYSQTGLNVSGNTTVFTNTIIHRNQEEPPQGKKPPEKRRGENYLIIEDYGTPLGVEVVINHVGDCVD